MGGAIYQFAAPSAGWYEFSTFLDWNTQDGIYQYEAFDDKGEYSFMANSFNYTLNTLPLKALYRGGYRIQYVMDTGTSATYVCYHAFTKVPGPIFPSGFTVQSKTAGGPSTYGSYSTQGTHVWRKYFDATVAVDIPYYGFTRSIPYSTTYNMGDAQFSPWVYGTVMMSRHFQQGEVCTIYLSAGDDAQFSYDIPIPYLTAFPEVKPTHQSLFFLNSFAQPLKTIFWSRITKASYNATSKTPP